MRPSRNERVATNTRTRGGRARPLRPRGGLRGCLRGGLRGCLRGGLRGGLRGHEGACPPPSKGRSLKGRRLKGGA